MKYPQLQPRDEVQVRENLLRRQDGPREKVLVPCYCARDCNAFIWVTRIEAVEMLVPGVGISQ